MAVQRRNIFGANYGTTKIERGKAHAPKIPPQGQPPVPLSLQAPAPLEGVPQPGQAQGQAQGLSPQDENMLQMLLARFGGQHG